MPKDINNNNDHVRYNQYGAHPEPTHIDDNAVEDGLLFFCIVVVCIALFLVLVYVVATHIG